MRRVLVVSPHFVPTDTVDMHRVRMTVGHYEACGWSPTVLSVRPELTGRAVDADLAATVPGAVEVVETGAVPLALARPLGLSALGLRAWATLDAAGSRLLAGDRFDLVFISTTAFPVMTLGRRWKSRFGVPFVLDFQDPWATFPADAAIHARTGPKHRAMRALHDRLERWTVPAADGLLAVTQDYIDLLQAAYPAVRDRPTLVSPFGYAARDFEVAQRVGQAPYARRPDRRVWYFAGRIAPAMEPSVAALFTAFAAGQEARPDLLEDVDLHFVGTGYMPRGNPPVARRIAEADGGLAAVHERPDRVSLMDSLKGMLEADVLLVFGSATSGYVPSKLHQALSLAKPVLCVAPGASPLRRAVEGLAGVTFLDVDEPARAVETLLSFAAAAQQGAGAPDRRGQGELFEAAACARRDCGLFDEVVAATAQREGRGRG